MERQREPMVIDLTEEPDSPLLQHHRLAMPQLDRRPSRNQPTVIDLTDDLDDLPPGLNNGGNDRGRNGSGSSRGEDLSMLGMRLSFPGLNQFALNQLSQFRSIPDIFQFGRRPSQQLHHHHAAHHHHHPHFHMQNTSRRTRHDHRNHRIVRQPVEFDLQIIGQHPAMSQMDNPLIGNIPELNYQANGLPQIPRIVDPDKPPHIPPPTPREGFTRDTGEEVVAVCASCDEELQYDPDGGKEEAATKRPKARRERGEHHFWAVTACGHVYCRRCFDNRRNAMKGDKEPTVGFRAHGKAILCAVDGCESDVSTKKSWVGLFV